MDETIAYQWSKFCYLILSNLSISQLTNLCTIEYFYIGMYTSDFMDIYIHNFNKEKCVSLVDFKVVSLSPYWKFGLFDRLSVHEKHLKSDWIIELKLIKQSWNNPKQIIKVIPLFLMNDLIRLFLQKLIIISSLAINQM